MVWLRLARIADVSARWAGSSDAAASMRDAAEALLVPRTPPAILEAIQRAKDKGGIPQWSRYLATRRILRREDGVVEYGANNERMYHADMERADGDDGALAGQQGGAGGRAAAPLITARRTPI